MEHYDLERSEVVDGVLKFDRPDGVWRAMRDGFFVVKIPDHFDLSAGDLFAQQFYEEQKNDNSKEDLFRGFKRFREQHLAKHEGYFLRDKDQTEQFFLEQRFWQGIYPERLIAMAEGMKDLSLAILRSVLDAVDLPKEHIDKATGGCVSGKGSYHLTFNHFRSQKRARGLNIHKDSGWVTILRSLEPGLEALIDKRWLKIDPVPGYFIVNFGCAIEILTQFTATPVSSIVHRVSEQPNREAKTDRFSYALFSDSSQDENICQGLYTYNRREGLQLTKNFGQFLDEILNKTYAEDDVGLY